MSYDKDKKYRDMFKDDPNISNIDPNLGIKPKVPNSTKVHNNGPNGADSPIRVSNTGDGLPGIIKVNTNMNKSSTVHPTDKYGNIFDTSTSKPKAKSNISSSQAEVDKRAKAYKKLQDEYFKSQQDDEWDVL